MARSLLYIDRRLAYDESSRRLIVFDSETGAGAECCCGGSSEPCDDSDCCTECGASFCTLRSWIADPYTDPRVVRSWHGTQVVMSLTGTLSTTYNEYHSSGSLLRGYSNSVSTSLTATWRIPVVSLCDFRGISVSGTVDSAGHWAGSLVTPSTWNYSNPDQWFLSTGSRKWWQRNSTGGIWAFPNSWTVFDTASPMGVGSVMFDQAKAKNQSGSVIDSFEFSKFLQYQITPWNIGFGYGALAELENCSGDNTVSDDFGHSSHHSVWSTSVSAGGGSFSASYDYTRDSGAWHEADMNSTTSGSWTITRTQCGTPGDTSGEFI